MSEAKIRIYAEGLWAKAEPIAEKCERCNGSGWQFDHTRAVRGRCRCQKPIDACDAWNRAGVPAKFANSSFDTWQLVGDADPSREVRAVADVPPGKGDQRGLILVGAPGRGKTHLAVASLRHAVFEHCVHARFVDFSHFRQGMKGRDPEKGWSPTELAAVPFLVLDDVPALTTEFERGLAGELIGRRYNGSFTTIITSNFGADELGTMLDPSAASRLRGMCTEVRVRGLDHRQMPGFGGPRG